MAILKIRDASGNIQEILAIKGNDGKDYVLTEADKQEIAGMVSGGGSVDLSDYALKSDVEGHTETLTDHENRISDIEEKSVQYNEESTAKYGYVVGGVSPDVTKKIMVDASNGLAILSNGNMIVSTATDGQIISRTSKPLSAGKIDIAVKEALANTKNVTWTADEQTAAQTTLGVSIRLDDFNSRLASIENMLVSGDEESY